MIDVTSLSAYELSQKLHSGEISSVDLCTAYLDRIKKFEKDVQAWQFLDKKLLIEKAEEADTYRKSGKPLGPLHGMPVAIKDIIGTYDMPTECGTVFRKKMSNSQDSEIVNLLKNSGAIIMGKTVTCELAYIHPSKTKNVELMEIFKGIMPFLGIVILAMFLMYLFPGIALWLPDTLFAN